jgi:hypothetical protein
MSGHRHQKRARCRAPCLPHRHRAMAAGPHSSTFLRLRRFPLPRRRPRRLRAQLDLLRNDLRRPLLLAPLVRLRPRFHPTFHEHERSPIEIGARHLGKLSPHDDRMKLCRFLLVSRLIRPRPARCKS